MTTLIKSKSVKAAVGLLAFVFVAFSAYSASAAYVFTQGMKLGSNSSEVKALQETLNANGFVVSTSGVGSAGYESTYFGGKTQAAVKAFQTAKGVSSIGIVGPATRAALNALTGGSSSSFPAGCTSASGFSPSTGLPCNGAPQQQPQGSGPVTVSLASDNPAAGYLVAGQASADLGHFTFSGSGTVSNISLQRTGLSTNTALTSVYLYNGATRLTEAASVNSVGVISFNNVNLTVNGSVTVSVKADLASGTSSSGMTVGVTLTGYTVTGSSATSANVAGNVFSISTGTGILAGAVVCQGGCATTSTVTVNAGLTQYILWTNPVQISTHAVWLKGASFHFIGSAPTDSLGNLGLYVDGVKVATAPGVNSLGYIVFDMMSNPLSLGTGSHTVDVRADIIKGSARTISLTLQNAGDLMITDSQVNVNIAPTITNSSTTFTATAGNTISVNAGSVTVNIDPTFTTATNVTGGSSNAVIGKFKLRGYGEDVKISTLRVTPSFSTAPTMSTGSCTNGTDCSLSNVTLYFNGSQIGTSSNWAGVTYIDFNLGSSLIVPAGVDSTLEVRADLMTTSSVNYTAGVVVVTLPAGSNNGQGMASLDSTIDVPASSVATTGLTIQTGVVGMAKNPGYASQTMNANTPNAKIASFVLQNLSSSEAVRVTNLGVAITYSTITSTNLGNLKTSETTGSGATPINPASSGTNNFSVDFTLAPGATKTLDVFADLGAASTGSTVTTLQLTALGASSNVTICASGVTGGSQNGCNTGTALTGQTITLGTGTFGTPVVVTSSSTLAQNVAGGTTTGSTDSTKAAFKFTATSGNATITELGFKDTVAGGALTAVRVGGSSAIVSSNKAFITQGLNIAVPQGGTGATVDAFASYSPVGSTGLTTSVTGDITSLFKLSYVKYTIGGTSSTLCANGDSPVGGNCTATTGMPVSSAQTMVLVGSKPTVTVSQPLSTILTTGNVEAIDVTITADAAGPVTIVSFPITASLSASSGSPTFATGSGNPFVVKDSSNTTISTVTGNFTSTAGGTATVTLNSTTGYLLNAGESQTFKVFLPVSALGTGTLPNTYMYTNLAATSGFAWIDTAGGATVTTTNVTGNIYNYPSTFTSSIHN